MPRGPKLDQEYSYAAVRDSYMPDVTAVHYVLIKMDTIVALRVREDYNPNILNDSAEIWVGAQGKVKEFGDELANRTKPVPLFVKKLGRRTYTFLGDYKVTDTVTTGPALTKARAAMKDVHEQGVSRIVFLKKV
jgi:hypothetical protein